MALRLRAPRLPRRLRLTTLLLPLTFFVLLFLLPLNRRSDILLEDIEDKLHVPHVHHIPAKPTDRRAGRPEFRGKKVQLPPPFKLEGGRPEGQKVAEKVEQAREARTHRHRHGVLSIDDSELEYLRQHPIETLISEAKHHARAQEARVPFSLDSAAALYSELNSGALPPAGFDKWYEFCQERDIKPWPHQTAYHSVEPYLSIPGKILRERLAELEDRVVTSIWNVGNGDVIGPTGSVPPENDRVQTLELLLKPLAPYLPEFLDGPFNLYFNTDDLPARSALQSVLAHSRALARESEVWDEGRREAEEEKQKAQPGWDYACPPGAKFLKEEGEGDGEDGDDDIRPKAFVYDQAKASDICLNERSLKHTHGTLIWQKPQAQSLVPLISQAVTSTHTDVIGLPLDHCNTTASPLSFAHKADHQIFWRGSTTGVWHAKGVEWRGSQRERLIRFARSDAPGSAGLLVNRGGKIVREEWHRKKLNQHWFDVGFAGKPGQCDNDDGTCHEMEEELNFIGRVESDKSGRYRYLVDVDGNGWSSRFRRLLSSGSVVFKSTIFREWNSPLLIPWYHYVPVQNSYSDVYDVMAFFEGLDGSSARSDLAEEIGYQGLAFVEDWWSWSDQQAYVLLLILELGRAMADDRAAATFGE